MQTVCRLAAKLNGITGVMITFPSVKVRTNTGKKLHILKKNMLVIQGVLLLFLLIFDTNMKKKLLSQR